MIKLNDRFAKPALPIRYCDIGTGTKRSRSAKRKKLYLALVQNPSLFAITLHRALAPHPAPRFPVGKTWRNSVRILQQSSCRQLKGSTRSRKSVMLCGAKTLRCASLRRSNQSYWSTAIRTSPSLKQRTAQNIALKSGMTGRLFVAPFNATGSSCINKLINSRTKRHSCDSNSMHKVLKMEASSKSNQSPP